MSGRKRKLEAQQKAEDELKNAVRTVHQRLDEIESYIKSLTSTYLEYVLQENRLKQIDSTVGRMQDRLRAVHSATISNMDTIELVWHSHQRLRFDFETHVATQPNTPETPTFNAQISNGPIILTTNENIADLFND